MKTIIYDETQWQLVPMEPSHQDALDAVREIKGFLDANVLEEAWAAEQFKLLIDYIKGTPQ